MILTTDEVSTFAEKVGVPLTIAGVGLAASIAVAVVTYALGRLGDTATRRGEYYSSAVRTLVAYSEYPFRIRRRVSDSPEDLRELVRIGHQLQEELRCHETWISSDSRWAGSVFREVREDMSKAVSRLASEAWEGPPITAAVGMNLGGWGQSDLSVHIDRFQSAAACRFGWRRAPALMGWHIGVLPRPLTKVMPPP